METIVDLEQMDLALQDILIRIEECRNLLDNGRILRCDRKLQGTIVKCNTIRSYIIELRTLRIDNGVVVNESDQTTEPKAAE